MRYISHINRLALVRENGQIAYQFENGELILGGTNSTGSGNVIDAKDGVTDGTAIQVHKASGSGLEKVGLGYLFWEAPNKSVALTNDGLVAGSWYKVLSGSVVHESVTYTAPQRFKAGATANDEDDFTGTGVLRFDIPAEYYDTELNERAESFRKAHLWHGDEATWNDTDFAPTEKTIGWLR